MNHIIPVPAVLSPPNEYGPPGSYFPFDGPGDRHYVSILCPCGCDTVFNLPVRPFGTTTPFTTWEWDPVSVTLHPSIRRLKPTCQWHGHLTHGTFIPCGDSGPHD